MVASTARYMGLRTYRYSPRTTSCSVGAGGAGVPLPWTANCANAVRSATAPTPVSTAPVIRTGTGQPAPGCHPVSHQGTRPATTPGAITRKAALPAVAVIFRIGPRPAIGRALLMAWHRPGGRDHVAAGRRAAGSPWLS